MRDLVDRTGLDMSLVSRFENARRIPTREQVGKLSRALQLDESLLLRMRLKIQLQDFISVEDPELVRSIAFELFGLDQVPVASSQEYPLERLEKLGEIYTRLWSLYPDKQAALIIEWKIRYCRHKLSAEGIHFSDEELRLSIAFGKTTAGHALNDYLQLHHYSGLFDFLLATHKNQEYKSTELLAIVFSKRKAPAPLKNRLLQTANYAEDLTFGARLEAGLRDVKAEKNAEAASYLLVLNEAETARKWVPAALTLSAGLSEHDQVLQWLNQLREELQFSIDWLEA